MAAVDVPVKALASGDGVNVGLKGPIHTTKPPTWALGQNPCLEYEDYGPGWEALVVFRVNEGSLPAKEDRRGLTLRNEFTLTSNFCVRASDGGLSVCHVERLSLVEYWPLDNGQWRDVSLKIEDPHGVGAPKTEVCDDSQKKCCIIISRAEGMSSLGVAKFKGALDKEKSSPLSTKNMHSAPRVPLKLGALGDVILVKFDKDSSGDPDASEPEVDPRAESDPAHKDIEFDSEDKYDWKALSGVKPTEWAYDAYVDHCGGGGIIEGGRDPAELIPATPPPNTPHVKAPYEKKDASEPEKPGMTPEQEPGGDQKEVAGDSREDSDRAVCELELRGEKVCPRERGAQQVVPNEEARVEPRHVNGGLPDGSTQ